LKAGRGVVFGIIGGVALWSLIALFLWIIV